MDDSTPTGFALALQLLDTGIRMQRQRLRRERPDADDAEVEAAVMAWLHERPGAPLGDGAPGRLVTIPRPARP